MKKKQKLAVDKKALEASIARDSFYDFLQIIWDEIIPEDPVWNWHIEYLCDEVQIMAERVFDRKPKEYDLIVNVSPGSTKSTICSVTFTPWTWTRDPTVRSICGSYAAALSLWLGTLSRKIINSDKYSELFPEITLVEEQKGFQTNEQGGQRIATSTGGGITGMHGHFLIVDDPINPQEAVSDKKIETANKWIDDTLLTRKVDRKITPLLLIMQRLSQKDPTGHLLKRNRDAKKKKERIEELKSKNASKEDIAHELEEIEDEQRKEQLQYEEEVFSVEKKSVKTQIGVTSLGDRDEKVDPEKLSEKIWNEKVQEKYKQQKRNDSESEKKVRIKERSKEKDKDGQEEEIEGIEEEIEEQVKFKQICLPAEITDNVQPESLVENYTDGLMDPERLGTQVLEEAKQELGEAGYSSQYLQNPIPSGGLMFKVSAILVEPVAPPEKDMNIVRFWDKAGSVQEGSAYTVGVKMGVKGQGRKRSFWILDMVRGQWMSNEREKIIRAVAEKDGVGVQVGIEVEPGSGGKESAENTIRNLAGFRVFKDRVTGDKTLRAEPFSTQVNNGNVRLVKGEWNQDYVEELKWYPKGVTKDIVDASSGAFNKLAGKKYKLGALNKDTVG